MWPFGVRVAGGELSLAEVVQLLVGGVGAVGEVGVAVAELLGEVEGAAVGDLACPRGGVGREPLGGLLRRQEHGFVVAAALALAAVEGGAVADRDEGVLEPQAALVVGVDVAGADGRDAEGGGELLERGVAAGIAALVRALELDVERPRERLREPGGGVRVGDGEPVAGAAGEADEPFGVLGDEGCGRSRREQVALAALGPRAGVRVGEDPAEVLVAAACLAEERDVGAALRASPRRR